MGLQEEEGVGPAEARKTDRIPAQPAHEASAAAGAKEATPGGAGGVAALMGCYRELRQTPACQCEETIHTFPPPAQLLSRCQAR